MAGHYCMLCASCPSPKRCCICAGHDPACTLLTSISHKTFDQIKDENFLREELDEAQRVIARLHELLDGLAKR
jgi:hypothetical protein